MSERALRITALLLIAAVFIGAVISLADQRAQVRAGGTVGTYPTM